VQQRPLAPQRQDALVFLSSRGDRQVIEDPFLQTEDPLDLDALSLEVHLDGVERGFGRGDFGRGGRGVGFRSRKRRRRGLVRTVPSAPRENSHEQHAHDHGQEAVRRLHLLLLHFTAFVHSRVGRDGEVLCVTLSTAPGIF
jgi:hypothetical protein